MGLKALGFNHAAFASPPSGTECKILNSFNELTRVDSLPVKVFMK